MIPDEGISLAYAGQGARTGADVATIRGGITLVEGTLSAGPVVCGEDTRSSRMILTAMRFSPEIRAVASIRYTPQILTICDEMLLEITSFDRSREPIGSREIDFGVAFCSERGDGVPDIIYDTGSPNHEPLIRIFGETPEPIAASINRIRTRIIDTYSTE